MMLFHTFQTQSLKWWKVLLTTSLGNKLILPTFRLDALVLPFTISCLPKHLRNLYTQSLKSYIHAYYMYISPSPSSWWHLSTRLLLNSYRCSHIFHYRPSPSCLRPGPSRWRRQTGAPSHQEAVSDKTVHIERVEIKSYRVFTESKALHLVACRSGRYFS